MKLLEISNLFNAITAVHANLKSYHMGWPSDMVRNVANNYDATQQTGTYYPAVLVTPPEIRMNPNSLQTVYSFRVHFIDLQAYGMDTEPDINTKVEQWDTLQEYAIQWIREIKQANKALTKPAFLALNNDNITGGLMDSAGQQRLIYVYYDFEILTAATCSDLNVTYPTDVTAAGLSWPPSSTADAENIFAP